MNPTRGTKIEGQASNIKNMSDIQTESEMHHIDHFLKPDLPGNR